MDYHLHMYTVEGNPYGWLKPPIDLNPPPVPVSQQVAREVAQQLPELQKPMSTDQMGHPVYNDKSMYSYRPKHKN